LVLFDGASVPAQPTKSIQLDGTGGVRRVEVSATYAGTTTAVRIDVLTGAFYSGLSNADAEVTDVQFETKPYATPFVNGTRGTTVATGGGFVDLSGNVGSGELVNGPTYNSSSLGYLVFDGVDDRLNLLFSQILSAGSSIEMWVSRGGTTSNSFAFAKVGDSTNRYYIRQNTETGFDAVRGNPLSAASFGSLDLNKFYQLTMVWDNTTIYAYTNGLLQNSSIYTNPNTNITDATVGSGPGSNANMKLSNFKLYNRALSAAEVLQNYNATKGRYGL
jgi:hypothetical protein